MESNTCSSEPAGAGKTAGAGEAARPGDLAALRDTLATIDRLQARAVALAGRLAGSGMCERVEGLPLELYLGLAGRLTGADRRLLVAAGETLRAMPRTAAALADGELSWGQVRAVVRAARGLAAAERTLLDARIGASLDAHDRVDPDALVGAVDAAAADLAGRAAAERAERRRRTASFLAVQPCLDGWVEGFFRLDPLLAAGVVNALDAAADRPRADAVGPAAPAATAPRRPTNRAQQHAQALGRVCAAWLGGGPNRPARPLLIAHVDLGDIDAAAPATVALGVRGDLPRLTAASVEALAADADVQAVLFDGARPLAATAKVRAKHIPAATRVAVAARDRGCRFPGSADPLAHGDIHHLVHREHGGGHDPANLAVLSRRFHTLAHRRGWRLTLDEATGAVTARRKGRAWRSLPRASGLAPPPAQRPPPAEGCRDRRPAYVAEPPELDPTGAPLPF